MEDSGDKSFQNLLATIYNSKTGTGQTNADTLARNLPLFFLRSGFYYNSTPASRSLRGFYWSLRGYSSASANNLDFTSTYTIPQYSNDRGYGFAVRCLAR